MTQRQLQFSKHKLNIGNILKGIFGMYGGRCANVYVQQLLETNVLRISFFCCSEQSLLA